MTAEALTIQLKSIVSKPDYRNRLIAVRAKLQTVKPVEGETDKWDSHHDHSNHVDNNETTSYKQNRISALLKSKYAMTNYSNDGIDEHTDFTDHSDFSDSGVS